MDKVKIGLIGLGKAWEKLHGPAFARLSDKFEITAVCSANIRKAGEVAAFLGLPPASAYGDYTQMLKKADIEAVDSMVPIYENYECAKTVIRSGRHLIAEKPFAAGIKSARTLIRLKEQYGVRVMVAENYRYDQENLLIKDLITQNKIGGVIYFIDNHVVDFPKEARDRDAFAGTEWRKHPEFKGGVFLDSGVHHVARHRFLFGSVGRIFASGHPLNADFSPYSCLNALLTFNNKVTGHYSFYVTGAETQAPPVGLRIFGAEGEIYLENRECGYVNVSYRDGRHEAIPYTPGEGYYRELINFYEALRSNAEIVSTPEKELGDIGVIFGILDSAARERAVRPAETYGA